MTHGPPPAAAESSRSSYYRTSSTPSAPTTSTSHHPPLYNHYPSTYPGTYTHPPQPPVQGHWPTNWYQYYHHPGQYPASSTPPAPTVKQEHHVDPSRGIHPHYSGYNAYYQTQPDQNEVNATPRQPAPIEAPSPAPKPHPVPSSTVKPVEKPPVPPPQPPENYEHWDDILKTFLEEAKLTESLKGLEMDMLVLSPDWETTGVYTAVGKMIRRFQGLLKRRQEDGRESFDKGATPTPENAGPSQSDSKERLDTRKLAYVSPHLVPNEPTRTPTTMTKSISQFLARNRARNNASNRAEFLYSLSERRKQLAALQSADSTTEATPQNSTDKKNGELKQRSPSTVDPRNVSSCARTDARPIDRDAQMKYDIAKNSDGPLSRTRAKGKANIGDKRAHRGDGADGTSDGRRVRRRTESEVLTKEPSEEEEEGTPSRYPALDDRLKNIEAHFAVRYVPSPPRTLLARLKFLEEHIIKLEKEYPPWAALWFCQPGRGWPPPPRTTPIIVPVHLRALAVTSNAPNPVSTNANSSTSTSTTSSPASAIPAKTEDESGDLTPTAPTSGSRPKATKPKKQQSSLYRAVMEKLEVKKALEDYRAAS
ncbi:hypothetical protein CC1G_03334 [Coprinopsis cinerea okayama7|uniref:Uncharacterized protein n=1 Tax=Coprinopsis cinerea (strain Okayama-7 / 130 / ATCC MYA-4618 / FGSC 9003) TaxID=240176 RepID=A8N7J1_COPC7|nr:hypothetical protein CC1G_03334 [Coprinopsis cinerea okayama7\|eukprot:XP_001830797.2 hypothetical protein CC1G_03334 [Coprinopsis cinerea okayama7\